MIIKKKSLVVALVSSFVISLVLVLTLVGYAFYFELKDEELKNTYQGLLQKVNAKFYARHLEISALNAKVEEAGPLKGKPLVQGAVKNKGTRTITDLLLRVKFLDRSGAIIYEVMFHPQEPSLGSSILTQVTIPYLSNTSKAVIKPGEIFTFKKILTNCPIEVIAELRKDGGFAKGLNRWSGKFDFEVLSVTF